MRQINRAILEEIKEKLPLSTFINLDWVGSSRGIKKAHCPFHDDRTPSFVLFEDTQTYHCFGCKEHGDIFDYIMRINGVHFYEAVEMCAQKLNIDLGTEKEYSFYSRFKEVMKLTHEFFVAQFTSLKSDHLAKVAITDRGLSLDSYDYGYAPENGSELVNYLLNKGVEKEEMERAGILNRMGTSFFFGRLIIPLKNDFGHVIGFSARQLKEDNAGKYINSKNTEFFDKSQVLFNMDRAKREIAKTGEVYVVEGPFDTIKMISKGYQNVVSVSGTALTKKHLEILLTRVRNKGKIILLFDADDAGRNSVLSTFTGPGIDAQGNLYVKSLPSGSDPCDYLTSHDELPEETESAARWIWDNIYEKELLGQSIENRGVFATEIRTNFIEYIQNTVVRQNYSWKLENISGVSGVGVAPKKDKGETKKPGIFIDLLSVYVHNRSILEGKLDPSEFSNEKASQIIKDVVENTTKESMENEYLAEVIYLNVVPGLTTEQAVVSHFEYLLDYLKRKERVKESGS